jgi:hypothetical protein
VNTTDCPPPTSELECIGTNIFGEVDINKVGTTQQVNGVIEVALFHVHEHANGTFEVDQLPFVDGSLQTTFKFRPLRSARIQGAVPLSDGTSAVIDIHLEGTGPSDVQRFTGSFFDPLCPNGEATGNTTAEQKNAIATGGATVEGRFQPPTSAVGEPFIFVQRSEGTCASV